MTKKLLYWALPTALALVHGMAVANGSVLVFTEGGANGLPSGSDGYFGNQTATSSGQATVTKSVSGSVSGTPYGGGPVSSSGTATATATDGLLGAYSTNSIVVSRFPIPSIGFNAADGIAESRASWNDLLTVMSAVPSLPWGTALTIHASVLLNGSLSGTPDSNTAFLVAGTGIGPGPNSFSTPTIGCTDQWCGALFDGVAPSGQSNFSSIPVTIHTFLGGTTLMQYSIDVDTRVSAEEGFGGTDTAASATADYGHTLGWGGISSITVDTTGSTLTGYTLSASDGFNYSSAVTAAVPEPNTYAMLLAGIGFIGLAARRRMQRAA